MSKAMIVHEIQVLEARLHQAMRLDRWDLWTWENEQRLNELRAELKRFEIK
jgi:hypothetical protein